MPPKGQPRKRQSVRNNQDVSGEQESTEAVNAPSPKELVAEDNDGPGLSMEADSQSIGITRSIESVNDGVPTERPSEDIPSSAPTVVADSSRPRRSVQRLTSVLPRSLPYPVTGEVSDSRPALKFKPKSFIRRSKEEREAVERAEAERQAAKLAAERGHDRSGYRGRGHGGRGGVGDSNRWKSERFNLSHEASGHLGGATIQDRSTRARVRGGYRGTGGDGGRLVPGGRGEQAGRGIIAGVGDARLGIEEPSEPAPTNPSRRVKKEAAVKSEKDKDGNVTMSSSTSRLQPKKTKVKKEDQAPTYVSSEGEFDSEGGKKVDIERINLVTSSEDSDDDVPVRSEISKGKQRQRTLHVLNNSLRPVRIQRQEHVERAVGVNTDASSLRSAELRRRAKERAEAGGSLFISEDEAEAITTPKVRSRRRPREVEFLKNERIWKGVYEDEDDKGRFIKIKEEPRDDYDAVVVDPERPKEDSNAMVVDTETPMPNKDPETMDLDEESGVPLHTAIQVPTPKVKETLRMIEDAERNGEVSEREASTQPVGVHPSLGRYTRRENLTNEQRDKLLEELREIWTSEEDGEVPAPTSKPTAAVKLLDDSDEKKMDNGHESPFQDDAEARFTYIFQLPPIIPSLRDSSKKVVTFKAEEKIKADEKKKAKAITNEGPKAGGSSNPFNVKEEPDTKPDRDALANDNAIPNAYIAGGFNYPGGHVGVLDIHARGQMRAYWGGMSLDVSKSGGGENVNQELMITDYASEMVKVEKEDDNRWEEKVDVGRKGWTMGQTQAGYKCVPDWGSLLT